MQIINPDILFCPVCSSDMDIAHMEFDGEDTCGSWNCHNKVMIQKAIETLQHIALINVGSVTAIHAHMTIDKLNKVKL